MNLMTKICGWLLIIVGVVSFAILCMIIPSPLNDPSSLAMIPTSSNLPYFQSYRQSTHEAPPIDKLDAQYRPDLDSTPFGSDFINDLRSYQDVHQLDGYDVGLCDSGNDCDHWDISDTNDLPRSSMPFDAHDLPGLPAGLPDMEPLLGQGTVGGKVISGNNAWDFTLSDNPAMDIPLQSFEESANIQSAVIDNPYDGHEYIVTIETK